MMNILTKRNGIALIAVLAILLVLTLLIPAMFTMSENATRSAARGSDELKASYLARTMIEMSVASFQALYDVAEEYEDTKNPDVSSLGGKNASQCREILDDFLNEHKLMDASTVYMYSNSEVPLPKEPLRSDYASDELFEEAYAAYETAIAEYENTGIAYTTAETAPEGFNSEPIGTAECKITYDNEVSYYSISPEGVTEKIDAETYTGGSAALEELIEQGVDASSQTQYVKINNKNVIFQSTATVNGKIGIRRCVMVLPTKPSEENWINPASLEVGCNQIFPDVSKATGRTNLNYDKGILINEEALEQPLYMFSCVGNMVISDEDLMVTRTNAYNVAETIPYYKYLREQNADYRPGDMSFGLRPETSTKNPENDPTFACLNGVNMNAWADYAQQGNFCAFTATNAIQVDLPVNLLVNPARAFRIGDGLSPSYPLYKVLIFQAPNIIFNKSVNSFVSLFNSTNPIQVLSRCTAYRMTSIMFAAPKSTPYSYLNDSRSKTVKAGKVYFAEDAYIWLIPYGERGSSYKTQTVYYKNSDMIMCKIANAGDIYYFNSEIETTLENGKTVETGFSMTGYFFDVIYSANSNDYTNTDWWQFYSKAKLAIFNGLVQAFKDDPTYLKDDFKWIGNVHSGEGDKVPVADDFYVIWDS